VSKESMTRDGMGCGDDGMHLSRCDMASRARDTWNCKNIIILERSWKKR
jgi:hypothetical protein